MHDNRLLTNTLNERTTKLNKIIQENLCVKSELDKSTLNNQKNEQKIAFYEEQLNLYKTNNENYQKIIKELKEQNDQLNISLSQMERAQEENQKITEEKLREEIENTRKNMEELYTGKRKDENEKIEKKAQVLIEQIKLLQEKNEELINELTNKENMFDLVCKENEKLTNENNLYRNQVDQYTNQINELNTIIKHKDGIINNLKSDNINNDKFLNKSSSYSMMKFDGSEYINENISKLITDNEENIKCLNLFYAFYFYSISMFVQIHHNIEFLPKMILQMN
jgi:Rad3-related DNA helicase